MNHLQRLSRLPSVSVIIPSYNDKSHLIKCVRNLLIQSYPSDKYEIIIIDNGSTDGTIDSIAGFPVKILRENSIQSSYAARNKGIYNAKGEVLAFTDSDCTPCQNWLYEGVKSLQKNHASLVGGNVRFTYPKKPSGAEIYDSLTNMQIKENINYRNVAKTANLFVYRNVFNEIGLFPNELQSGGDVIWTGRATSLGFKLAYAPLAEVSHPTRNLKQLIKKQYRVGKGQTKIWSERSRFRVFFNMIKVIAPTNAVYIYIKCINCDNKLPFNIILRVCLAGMICNSANLIGNIAALNNK